MSWIPVKTPKIETFLSESEDQSLIIIKSGFENQYHVVEESAHDGKIGHDDLYTKEQLQTKFGIEVTI